MKNTSKLAKGVFTILLVVILAQVATAGAVIFEETFSDNATQAQFAAAYPGWTVSGLGTHQVSGGNLILAPQGDASQEIRATIDASGFAGPYEIEARLGGGPGTPFSYNVKLIAGTNAVVFHPGYAQGTLRVEGPGGFANLDVGFTPAEQVLHTLRINYDGVINFQGTFIDGQDPGKTFNFAWTNGTPVAVLGFARQSENGVVGIFSELTVDQPPPFCQPIDPIDGIDDAISGINDLGLDPGTTAKLLQKLREAKDKYSLGDLHDARSKIYSFVVELEAAVAAGKLVPGDANILLNKAGAILAGMKF
jgi:hypothetical protein